MKQRKWAGECVGLKNNVDLQTSIRATGKSYFLINPFMNVILILFTLCLTCTLFAQEAIPKELPPLPNPREADFDDVLEMPTKDAEFPGGSSAMQSFIAANVQYPQESLENHEEGRVYIRFVVEIDGSLTNIEVIGGKFPALNAEGVRLIQSMPNWIPGKANEKSVRVRMTVPINFSLR